MNWLPQATNDAAEVDHLILALTAVAAAVLLLVFGLLVIYMVRYREGSATERGGSSLKSWVFEIAWTMATLAVFFGLFLWGANLYVRLFQPPDNALQIYVIAKQWMWKAEHQGGQREINSLHVPTGRPVQLVMTSQDVIHDFAIPAFRIKHDVLPGRYETLWFEVRKPGTYRLFCTQLCGAGHSAMTGEIVAMTAPDFERWISSEGGVAGQSLNQSLKQAGAALFVQYGCNGCHGEQASGGANGMAPALAGLFGSKVKLENGAVRVVDERYIRDCVTTPEKTPVAGYPKIMPSFAGQIDEESLLKLIAYIKSLSPKEPL